MPNTYQKPTLLALPRELRDIIYSFIFTSTIVNVAHPPSHTTRNTSILATCHQTRAEALKSYYKNTRFHAPVGPVIFPWSRKIPKENCKCLREVQRDSPDFDASWRHRAEFIKMFVDVLERKDPRIYWRKVLRVRCRIASGAPAEWWSLEGWEEAGEIRDIIYEYAFTSNIVNVTKSGHIARNSGILASCHQTRAEAIESYFKLILFRIPVWKRVRRWLQRVPCEYDDCLRTVRREVDGVVRRHHKGKFPALIETFVIAARAVEPRIEWEKVLKLWVWSEVAGDWIWCSLEEWDEVHGKSESIIEQRR